MSHRALSPQQFKDQYDFSKPYKGTKTHTPSPAPEVDPEIVAFFRRKKPGGWESVGDYKDPRRAEAQSWLEGMLKATP
jgi:hypothetical protein